MIRLVAHFTIELPGQCLVVSLAAIRQTPLHCTINGFEVNVQAKSLSRKLKAADDQHWTYILESLVVKVARDEDEAPPPVIPDAEGLLDYTIQSEYFSQRIGDYSAAACEAVNRVIQFFKFELNTPFLHELSASHQSFRNAEWRDESGTLVGKGNLVHVAKGVPGLRGALGVQKLRRETVESLQAALAHPREPLLYEQVLSVAQTALFEGNLRRAVLELAIASELVVEGKFLSGDSPAVKAFEYLEEKARFRVRVVDYIDGVAKEAFQKSFRRDHRKDYDHINDLFQCRNKIAHTGQLSYEGQPSVTYEVVARWWDSVVLLIKWLGALNRST
ncbi:MAG: hypothetical protein M3361_17460 [Candidatus Tectomicrobia bacterium]|nr:hypothetical protein [Candidatus Tectomicrobia bacterium]